MARKSTRRLGLTAVRDKKKNPFAQSFVVMRGRLIQLYRFAVVGIGADSYPEQA